MGNWNRRGLETSRLPAAMPPARRTGISKAAPLPSPKTWSASRTSRLRQHPAPF